MSDVGICALCVEAGKPSRFPLEHMLEHLQLVHGQDVDLATWPDGELVVVDSTLGPDDFGDRA